VNIEKIIEKVKAFYSEHDDLDEMISDFENQSYYDHWAQKMFNEEFGINREIGRALFELELSKAESSTDYRNLGEFFSGDNFIADKIKGKELFTKALQLAENLNDKIYIADSIATELDKDWAKELYQEYEKEIQNLEDYNKLIDSVKDKLEDENWAEKLIINATSSLLKSDDIIEYAQDSYNIITLAEYIFNNDKEEDAKEVFNLVKQYEDVNELLEAARKVGELYNDEYLNQYQNEILQKAIECVDEGYYCDIYNFIVEDLEDEEKAQEFRDNYEEEMRQDNKEYNNCEELFDEPVDIDTTGYFKIDIMSTGGEFAYGIIDSEEKLAVLKEKIEDNSISLNMSDSNGNEVMFYECDDQLFQCYGPDVNYSTVAISVYSDEDCEDELEEVVSSKETDKIGFNIFTYDNPWYKNEQLEEFSSDALQYGGYYTEKRIHFPAVINIEDGEKFNPNFVYVGTTNMDETLSNDEIVSIVLYITDEKAKEILDIYLEENDDENLSDYLSDIYNDIKNGQYEDISQILRECEAIVLDIEGKGESEEHYAIVKDLDGDILCEGDEYSS
jgi:hypothetical protein